MAHTPFKNGSKGAGRHASPDSPYCEFKDDRERWNALMSRDLRIVGCRLITVVGVVLFAACAPEQSTSGAISKILGPLISKH